MYGIDFGTTYTVVSYKKGEKVHYLSINSSALIPTKVDNIENLKRLILEEGSNINSELESVLIKFFNYIYKEIEIQLSDFDEYKNCVITVPIRFDDLARNIIKKIATICKFHVIKLLGEPIAAAVGELDSSRDNGHYIVYDLGGGTFDATLLNFQDDMYHIKKVDGLSNFGGIDIDEFIAKNYKISLKEAKNLKIKQYLPELDEILQPTYDIIMKLSKGFNINAIILTGGSSYLINIEEFFKKYFNVLKNKELQLMVAKGSCIYGYDFLDKQKFLIDVTPFNLGIETLGDKMSVIIPINSPIPVIKKEEFLPVNSKVALKIMQGLSDKASECTLIRHLSICSTNSFEVSFIIDYDGILFVKILDNIIVIDDLFKR